VDRASTKGPVSPERSRHCDLDVRDHRQQEARTSRVVPLLAHSGNGYPKRAWTPAPGKSGEYPKHA